MCGMMGIIFRSSQSVSAKACNALYSLSARQGHDAWGYITAPSMGEILFNKGQGIYPNFSLVPKNPGYILVHARAATSGNPSNNNNNHPVVSSNGRILINHNGMVDDDNIYRWLKDRGCKVKPYCEVDTLGLAEALAFFVDQGFPLMKSVSETFKGLYSTSHLTSFPRSTWMHDWLAIAAVDAIEPQKVILAAYRGPISLAEYEHCYIYGSRSEWVNAFGNANLVNTGKLCSSYILDDGEIMQFNTVNDEVLIHKEALNAD